MQGRLYHHVVELLLIHAVNPMNAVSTVRCCSRLIFGKFMLVIMLNAQLRADYLVDSVCKGSCSTLFSSIYFHFSYHVAGTPCLCCACLGWGCLCAQSAYAFGDFSARTFTGPNYVSEILMMIFGI